MGVGQNFPMSACEPTVQCTVDVDDDGNYAGNSVCEEVNRADNNGDTPYSSGRQIKENKVKRCFVAFNLITTLILTWQILTIALYLYYNFRTNQKMFPNQSLLNQESLLRGKTQHLKEN